MRTARWCLLATVVSAGCLGGDGSTDELASEVTSTSGPRLPDFNGDGYSDLAVGTPEEDVTTTSGNLLAFRTDAGVVHVLYGSASGVTGTGAQSFNASAAGGAVQSNARFGAAVAWGDFNRDGRSDLVVGSPGANSDTGVVYVLYGSSGGLTTTGAVALTLATTGEAPATGDFYGASLAAGDFNGDGTNDLAVGAPGRDVVRPSNNVLMQAAGAVHVVPGISGSGLNTTFDLYWTLATSSLGSGPSDGERFGFSLAAGNFDGDAATELAVGRPGWGPEFQSPLKGRVHVLDFDGWGYGLLGHQTLDITQAGLSAAASDRFGYALATGDFNGDGRADLAVGVPSRETVAVFRAPASGNNTGLLLTGVQTWSQDSSNIGGATEFGDHFGASLAAGDFNNDYRDDLAVGVPGEGLDGGDDAGTVNVIFGSGSGLTSSGNILVHQDVVNVSGVSAAGDRFGRALIVGDFNRDNAADLAITVPGEDFAPLTDNGMVQIFRGSTASGLVMLGSASLSQDTVGVPDACESNDRFGGQQVSPLSWQY